MYFTGYTNRTCEKKYRAATHACTALTRQ